MNIGVANYYFSRLMTWAGRVSQFMVILIYFDRGWNWWWLVVALMIPVVAYIEWRWIVPQELSYQRKRGGYAGKDDK